MQGIFSGIQKHAPGMGHLETSQTRTPRGHGDRQIQGEEGLATLGFPTDDAELAVLQNIKALGYGK